MAMAGEAVQFTYLATYAGPLGTITFSAPATTITFPISSASPTESTVALTMTLSSSGLQLLPTATVVVPLSKLSFLHADMEVQSVEVRAPGDTTDSASATSLASSTHSSVGVMASASTTSSVATASSTNVALSSSRPGLSDGAKAGIGVGAAVGCIMLAGVIGYLLLRMKKHLSSGGDTEHNPIMKAELHGEGVEKPKPHVVELGEDELYEAGGLHKPPEMDNMNVRAELEGNWHGYEAATESPESNSIADR